MVDFATTNKPNILRLVVHPNLTPGGPPRCLVTHLNAGEFNAQAISDAYRWRWQIELLFKEWKSYNNLPAFDTSNTSIAEGLIGAALCSATVARYYAHVTEQLTATMISTQCVVKCIDRVLLDILYDMMHRPHRLKASIIRAVQYLSHNARRAHPKRDMKTGRLKLGLKHCTGNVVCAGAAVSDTCLCISR